MTRFYLVFIGLFFFSNLNAQSEQTDLRLYLWDFEDKSGTLNKLSKEITKEFEQEFINQSCFTILERRNIATLRQHITNELTLREVEEIPKELKNKLKLKGADGIILGEIVYDNESANYTIWVNIVIFDSSKKVQSFDLNKPKLKVKEIRTEEIRKLVNKISIDLDCNNPKPFNKYSISGNLKPIIPSNPWRPKPAQTAGFIVGGGTLLASLLTKILSNKSYDMHTTATDPAEKKMLYDKAVRLNNISINTFYASIPVLSGAVLWYGIDGLRKSKIRSDIQTDNYNVTTMYHQIGITINF